MDAYDLVERRVGKGVWVLSKGNAAYWLNQSKVFTFILYTKAPKPYEIFFDKFINMLMSL